MKINTEIENASNVKKYQENGCTFIVRREFETSGTSVLEQVIAFLLDLMEKQETTSHQMKCQAFSKGDKKCGVTELQSCNLLSFIS